MYKEVPVVSVIIPAYRCEQILARALGGLLAQSFGDWEAVIVDDGSPESTWGVIQAYTWLDPRIRAIRQQKNAGACAARNAGIAESHGGYLLFLDADDWLESSALQRLVQACEANGWAAAHGGLQYVTQDGTPTDWKGGAAQNVPLLDAVCSSNALSVPSCVLLRRAVLDEIGLFDTTLVHCGDWDLWARLARHATPSGAVDAIVTCYRMSPGSLSRNPQTLLRDATTVLRRIHAPDPRVLRPAPQYARGADPRMLDARIAQFAVYAAGLGLPRGKVQLVDAVLDTISDWPPLNPTKAGEFLFYALCFAHCRGPESAREFWPGVAAQTRQLTDDIERRCRIGGLSRQLWAALEACAAERLLDAPPQEEPAPNSTTARHDSWETYATDTLFTLAHRQPHSSTFPHA